MYCVNKASSSSYWIRASSNRPSISYINASSSCNTQITGCRFTISANQSFLFLKTTLVSNLHTSLFFFKRSIKACNIQLQYDWCKFYGFKFLEPLICKSINHTHISYAKWLHNCYIIPFFYLNRHALSFICYI